MEDTVAAACGETTFPWDEEIAKGPGFVLKSLSYALIHLFFSESILIVVLISGGYILFCLFWGGFPFVCFLVVFFFPL